MTEEVREQAFAKVNLVLRVGAPRADGMHPLTSLLASLDLADEVTVGPAPGHRDVVICPDVPGENLAVWALEAFREAAPGELPPLKVRIEKRVPVAAGLGGGSADAAAVLRAANALAGSPLDRPALRALGLQLGADVPGQVDPGAAVVTGVGEHVQPVELPEMAFVLVPRREGLATVEVYRELDRLGLHRERLDPGPLRELAGSPVGTIAAGVENDLEPAALSLRPDLGLVLETVREAGSRAAALSGSGPTAFGLFEDQRDAEQAADGLPGSLVARARRPA